MIGNVGVSYLAAMHDKFPAQIALQAFPDIDNPTVAVLWGTFGKNKAFIKDFMTKFPKGTVQIYLSNEVARRKTMYKGELFRKVGVQGYNNKLVQMTPLTKLRIHRRIFAIKSLLEKHKKQHTLILSLGLEDQFTNAATGKLLQCVKEVWPYKTSRNPMGDTFPKLDYGPYFLDYGELHGLSPNLPQNRFGVYCNDGDSIDLPDSNWQLSKIQPSDLSREIKRRRQFGGFGLAWWGEAQGLAGDSGSAVEPRKRNISISSSHISVVKNILKDAL